MDRWIGGSVCRWKRRRRRRREVGRWTMVVTFVVGAEAVCVLLRCEVDVGSASREVHRPPIHIYVWREREREID